MLNVSLNVVDKQMGKAPGSFSHSFTEFLYDTSLSLNAFYTFFVGGGWYRTVKIVVQIRAMRSQR